MLHLEYSDEVHARHVAPTSPMCLPASPRELNSVHGTSYSCTVPWRALTHELPTRTNLPYAIKTSLSFSVILFYHPRCPEHPGTFIPLAFREIPVLVIFFLEPS